MRRAAKDSEIGGRAGPWIGGLLIAQFVVALAIKSTKGVGEEMLWMSHVSLLLAGAGLLLRREWPVSGALAAVFFIHGIWTVDLISWLLGFGFPLNVAGYMSDAPVSTWISTSHHVWLVPLLLVLVWRHGRVSLGAWPAAIGMYVVLTVASRLLTSPDLNINCAFTIDAGPDLPLIRWLNGLSGGLYLIALNALTAVLLFLPVVLLLRGCLALRRRKGRGTTLAARP